VTNFAEPRLKTSMNSKPNRVKVLYIAGYPRNGSTLLLRLLAGGEGFVAVGELYDLWTRSFIEDQLCGCGRPFSGCPFWRSVVAKAFAETSPKVAAQYEELRRRVQSTRYLPWLLARSLRPATYRRRIAEYVKVLARVYEAIHVVSEADVIIESSKIPAYGLLLSEVPNIEMHVVHLVRDSRATAFSWQRRKLRPEIHWRTQYMDLISPTRTAAEWTAINLLLSVFRARVASYSRLHYEDFVTRPRKAAEAISRQVGVPRELDEVVDEEGFIRLGIDHTVSGNPARFSRGRAKIRLDDEWRDSMPRRDVALVTAISSPLLVPYGYLPQRSIRQRLLDHARTARLPADVPGRRSDKKTHEGSPSNE
jgi:hypothetical protein